MRNWNPKDNSFLYIYSTSFYFTYEELKLAGNVPGRYFGKRFYFTYEELKQAVHAFLGSLAHSFYFTYEELKRNAKRITFWPCAVFTLPMRNWNCVSRNCLALLPDAKRQTLFMPCWRPIQFLATAKSYSMLTMPMWKQIVPLLLK